MSEFVIETNNLSKHYGDKIALDDFSIQIPREGVSSIIGANGAGKSTLFRILLGLLRPTYGSSKMLGVDSQVLTELEREKIGFVNEEHSLPLWMKVKALAEMQKGFYKNWDDGIYKDVVSNFNVGPEQKVKELSRGERAGVNLAMAMAQQPEVLILDEPTLGLDVVAKRAFIESLLFSQENSQSAIIYCSHVMEEVERVSDQLIVMERGSLKNQSSPDDFVARVKYWVADFLEKAPTKSEVPGLLQQQIIDGQYHYLVLDQNVGFDEFLQQKGASEIYSVPVNLDRAVNGFLAKNHISSQERA